MIEKNLIFYTLNLLYTILYQLKNAHGKYVQGNKCILVYFDSQNRIFILTRNFFLAFFGVSKIMNIKDLPLRPLLTPYKINRTKIKFCFKIAHFGHFFDILGSDTNFRELAPKIRVQLIVPERMDSWKMCSETFRNLGVFVLVLPLKCH